MAAPELDHHATRGAPNTTVRGRAAAAQPHPARRTGLLAGLLAIFGLFAPRMAARTSVVVKNGWFLAGRDR